METASEQETERLLAQDRALYGSSYCRVDTSGKRVRIDPRDVMIGGESVETEEQPWL